MATLQSVMAELSSKGSEKTRVIYARHGNHPKQMFGVSVANLKEIAKTIRGQQALAGQLYETGNLDAMYLAGMVADGSEMPKQQLQAWAEGASGMPMVSEYTVPWVAVADEALVMVGVCRLVSVKVWVPALPTPFVALMVTEYFPPVVAAGLPERSPEVFVSVTPEGSVPVSVNTGAG